MHTICKTKDGDVTLYTVGSWQPTQLAENGNGDISHWFPLYDTTSKQEAFAVCSYLNGGERVAVS